MVHGTTRSLQGRKLISTILMIRLRMRVKDEYGRTGEAAL